MEASLREQYTRQLVQRDQKGRDASPAEGRYRWSAMSDGGKTFVASRVRAATVPSKVMDRREAESRKAEEETAIDSNTSSTPRRPRRRLQVPSLSAYYD